MPTAPFYSAGQLSTLGVGKETTFGVIVTPTIWHSSEQFTPTGKNAPVDRTGFRGRPGRTTPAPGPYSMTGSLKVDADPDMVGQLLAYALGTQSTPIHPTTPASTVAYTSALTFGPARVALTSFTMEFFRGFDAIDWGGCAVDTIKLTSESAKPLAVDLGIVAANEVINPSPANDVSSNLLPYTMEAPSTVTSYGPAGGALSVLGSGTAPTVKKWTVDINNQLDKSLRGAGLGRYPRQFPLGQRKVSGTLTLGFENNLQYLDFQAVNQIQVQHVIGSFSVADSATTPKYYYQLSMLMGNCFIESDPVPSKVSGPLESTFSFQSYETAAGNADDITLNILTKTATAY